MIVICFISCKNERTIGLVGSVGLVGLMEKAMEGEVVGRTDRIERGTWDIAQWKGG